LCKIIATICTKNKTKNGATNTRIIQIGHS
jgi:hypothetical protein